MSSPENANAPIPFPAAKGNFASDQVKWRGIAFDYGERILIVPPLLAWLQSSEHHGWLEGL